MYELQTGTAHGVLVYMGAAPVMLTIPPYDLLHDWTACSSSSVCVYTQTFYTGSHKRSTLAHTNKTQTFNMLAHSAIHAYRVSKAKLFPPC